MFYRKNKANGKIPVLGTGWSDWQKAIPFWEMPQTFNPSRGYIATANNRIVPSTYKYFVTVDWDEGADGYRARRITDVLSQNKKV